MTAVANQTRLAKIALLAAAAFALLLIVFNNLVDYSSNYVFVQHVLSMDTLSSGEAQAWRALRDPTPADNSYWFHHAFYVVIIAWEALSCALIAAGTWRLWQQRATGAAAFNAAKRLAVLGLTVSMLLWLVAFIGIGGEWFLMWQSTAWNGQDAAFRMFACLGIVLVILNQRDDA